MSADVVLDASVLARCLITEPGSEIARCAVDKASRLIAPDCILLEVAELAAEKVRLGQIPVAFAQDALREAAAMPDELVASAPFMLQALQLSAAHGLSASGGVYLALARERGLAVLTASTALARGAADAGLARHVQLLPTG